MRRSRKFPGATQHPAEILVRALLVSPWMRRLWTLQEGALARSLYFQLADGAVVVNELLFKLFDLSKDDMRYCAVSKDIMNEVPEPAHDWGWEKWTANIQRLSGLCRSSVSLAFLGRTDLGKSQLERLHNALEFRAVTVASDEPLCIATLLGLEMERIVKHVQRLDQRMARVWEVYAERHEGKVPSRLIFHNIKPIRIPGWRWAPRTLLRRGEDWILQPPGWRMQTQHRDAEGEEVGQIVPGGLLMATPGADSVAQAEARARLLCCRGDKTKNKAVVEKGTGHAWSYALIMNEPPEPSAHGLLVEIGEARGSPDAGSVEAAALYVQNGRNVRVLAMSNDDALLADSVENIIHDMAEAVTADEPPAEPADPDTTGGELAQPTTKQILRLSTMEAVSLQLAENPELPPLTTQQWLHLIKMETIKLHLSRNPQLARVATRNFELDDQDALDLVDNEIRQAFKHEPVFINSFLQYKTWVVD
ncbi:hypothetical protein PspLS_06410 [Pyricularia sp. CBS 133598]|nr:hypothetical protein PspLS_06410 [Pyricularia sp. CBS 133598]